MANATADGVEATAKRRDDYAGMICSGVNVEPSANGGFIVRQSFRPPTEKAKKGDTCCGPMWIEPKTLVFKTVGEITDFLKTAFPAPKK